MRHAPPRPFSRIQIPKTFGGQSLPEVLSRLHLAASAPGADSIELDFSECLHVYEAAMLPLFPILDKYRATRKIHFDIKLPKKPELRNLFTTNNWAHFLDPFQHFYDAGGALSSCPALRFSNATEQYQAVDRALQVVFSSVSVTRDAMRAIEWSVNEITDNVLNHAKSDYSGYLQATYFKKSQYVEFIVADAGIGIAKSLRLNDHKIALERSIQEGVTRNRKTNQGNGLYGSFRISSISGGVFAIYSGFATLARDRDGETHIRATRVPYKGTIVRWSLQTDQSDLISKALIFKGAEHDTAFDFVHRLEDESDGSSATVALSKVLDSFGSREAGMNARTYLVNLMSNGIESLTIDFDGINVISSSFADEVFGRIFVELGPISFMRRVKFVNIDRENLALIDRAMVQRSGMQRG